MATKKAKAKTQNAKTQNGKTKKLTKEQQQFTLDEEVAGALPGGGAPFARATPEILPARKGQPTKTALKIRTTSGDEEYVEHLDGVIVKHHPFRSLTIGSYDPSNPRPPDCVSVDAIEGAPREESLAQLQTAPGYNAKCQGCPWNSKAAQDQTGNRCNIYRMVYLLPKNESGEIDDQVIEVKLSRTADRGDENTFMTTFAGKDPRKHLTRFWTELQTARKGGATYRTLRCKILGEKPISDWDVKVGMDQVEGAGPYLLPASTVDVKQLEEATTADESWD